MPLWSCTDGFGNLSSGCVRAVHNQRLGRLAPLDVGGDIPRAAIGGFGGFYGITEPQGRAEISGCRLLSGRRPHPLFGGFGGFYGVVEPQGRAEILGHRLASPVSSAPMAAARIGHIDAGAGHQAGRGAPACSAFQPCAWGHIRVELGAHP